MRKLIVLFLMLSLPAAVVYAEDSSYHYQSFNNTSQNSGGNMDYWDDGGFARQMLVGGSSSDSGSGGQGLGSALYSAHPVDCGSSLDVAACQNPISSWNSPLNNTGPAVLPKTNP